VRACVRAIEIEEDDERERELGAIQNICYTQGKCDMSHELLCFLNL